MDLKQASISDRTHSCLESFSALTHSLEAHRKGHGEDLSLLAVEDQIGRFRLWAGNIGALQEGRGSLDYRLRDAKFVVENVQRLLDSLQASLIRATHAAGHSVVAREKSGSGKSIPSDYETSSDSSGGSDLKAPGQSELAGYYLAITEIIGRLFKLSIAIRSPSIQNAAARSASFIDKDEDGNDLSAMFEEYILQRIVHHYPGLSRRIAERLSRAIERRRRQFMYQRRHREKLGRTHRGGENSTILAQTIDSDNLKSSLPHELAVPTSQRQVTTEPEPTVFHRSILSETTATQYVPRPEQPQAPSAKSFSTASGIFQGSKIDIPPSILPDKDQEFECPYCFFILSSEFKEPRTWRKHVFDDLEPYSCLFEDCPTPDQTFNKYNEWVYHEDWSHNLQWCCDLASHELQLFDLQSKLEDHLQEVHNEDVKNSGVRQLIERNKRPAPILWTECPFCKFVPDLADIRDVSAGLSQDELASKKLVKHIGHHLQAISVLALPWRDDLKDDANSELNESSKARDREVSSQLDESEFEETDHHDEADYELDLRSVASTDDQRWNMDPAGFQEIDRDDPVIQHLIFNQTDWFERIEDQFAPLGPGRTRLLRLHPGKPDEMIHCDRLAISLQHPPAYKYLSYVWGDMARQMSITVGREPFNITANLYSALRAIRAQDSTLTLWVDCLCINLDDLEEKSFQVALLPQIARSASETIVWLGEDDESSEVAIKFVDSHNNFIGKLGREEILAVNDALVSLFAREWWTRVWMVQEVILAKSVTVTCGSWSTSFEEFVHLRNFQLPQELLPDYQLVMQSIKKMPFGDLLLVWDQLQSEILNDTETLFSMMTATRKLQSTNLSDKVYALLGLCWKNSSFIRADYMKPYFQVYKEAMRYFLISEGILPLYVVEEHQPISTPNLPSWVIDWSVMPVPRTGFAFDGQRARSAYLSICEASEQKMLLSDDGDRILCRGIHIDKIIEIGEPFESVRLHSTTLVSCCRKWWELYRAHSRNGQDTREGFWRTLIANRLENFEGEPSITFLQDFKSWLEWDEGRFYLYLPKNKKLPDDRVDALIRRSCLSRTFAVTSRGYPALVPERAQIGDDICVLFGGDVPFVLRQRQENWSLIGEAYVHGFMDGEALKSVERGDNKIELFAII